MSSICCGSRTHITDTYCGSAGYNHFIVYIVLLRYEIIAATSISIDMRYLLHFLRITAPGIIAGALSGYLSAEFTVARAIKSPRIVTAQKLTLVNGSGRIGAQLSWEESEPSLKLFDQANRLRCALFLEPNGTPDLYLYDDHEKTRAALNLFDSGVPNLAFNDAAGNLMWTDFDNHHSYNTKFIIRDGTSGRLVVRHGIIGDASGIKTFDTVEKR